MKKCIIFVRHGESYNNIIDKKRKYKYESVDPSLTEKGIKQANLIKNNQLIIDPDLVIVSPLKRAIQTCAIIYGEKPKNRVLISALHTEKWTSIFDQGSTKTDLINDLPFIEKWEGLEYIDEEWGPTEYSDRDWKNNRIPQFLKFISNFSEKKIVVIGHAGFFKEILGYHMKNCDIRVFINK